ncbi:unnamed protein product [Brassicogethes aeneus]|uniref:Uncharacterized protein n=1 Tax=Brassicogethes aeneus TaxID=1431903 RepID=A0A9P0BCV1_BRAAE|nr:unnamed protein product [Brassicogethes aeneus]
MVFQSEDEDVIKIYKDHAKLSQNLNLFFMAVGYLTTIPFYVIPMYAEKQHPELYTPNNVTGKIDNQRPLPFSSWYPYDTNDHYVETFAWQIFTGPVIEGFVVYTDSYLYSLMVFAVGQMKILQHILGNFKLYSKKFQERLNVNEERASQVAIKSCILFHQEIIQYVEELNRAVRTVMLLDFISCSIQMSVIVFQIIMSKAISKSVGNSEWYNESKEVKHDLQVIITRAQKPLTVSIGTFYPMSTDTAIAILKATYSYGMLIRQSYNRKL